MNHNPDITGGAGEQVLDILENIPSDSERQSVSDAPNRTRFGGFRFRRPASFTIFRAHGMAASEARAAGDVSSLTFQEHGESSSRKGPHRQSAGEDSDEKQAAALMVKHSSDIYNISGSVEDEEIDPLSNDYVGIIANYFSVGLMIGGSTSLLYPVLIVQGGATSSLMTASYAVVMAFWSYKIFFGFLSDCFPILGYKRKPYIVIGWFFCASVLIVLAKEGNDVDPSHMVMMFATANAGYVMADVAADGFMVWVAHREPIEKRGKMQTLVYSMNKLGQIAINILILLGFSGPLMNCAGYEPDPRVPCTDSPQVIKRVEKHLLEASPTEWCYEMCHASTFDWDLSIPEFALSICFVIAASIPLYLRLKEDKVKAEPRGQFLHAFWKQLQRRAAWQVILYGMISHITFGVMNAAKMPANYVWLELHTFQHQIMVIFEKFFFFVGLNLVRRYALNVSWRKQVLFGSFLVTVFNSLYFIIIFDIWRNSWFYIFTDVSAMFMYTLNFLASHACMVEVAEPGYEAITYSLITTASNAVTPLSAVISYQLLAFFPSLNDQESIATDTPAVRRDFATLHFWVIIINLSSLISLPLLPRQKKETRELVAKGEKSTAGGLFVILSAFIFLIYSTAVTVITVKYHDVYGCAKMLGGGGCSEDESSVMAVILIGAILLYCYGTNFYLSFWPILRGERRFSWQMFL
mmetsp:Transcript_27271/g.55681  ORF Transcript_27271/g.55681 Transcript_27271/m.55681 type:complete len:693 (-) Transcript_27271:288-2366(-)